MFKHLPRDVLTYMVGFFNERHIGVAGLQAFDQYKLLDKYQSTAEEVLAAEGQLSLLIWAVSRGCTWTSYGSDAAAEKGHRQVLEWAAKIHPESLVDKTMEAAVRYGDLTIVKWLRDMRCPVSTSVCNYAAKQGHLELLKWLWTQSDVRDLDLDSWTDSVTENAAARNHLRIVEWLHNQGCPLSMGATLAASNNHHWDLLKWIKQHGGEWHYWSPFSLSTRAPREVLEWSKQAGLDWSDYHCCDMASAGHLEGLEWVLSENTPHAHMQVLDPRLGQAAARYGHLHIVEWLLNRGVNYQESWATAASFDGQLDILKWFTQHGYSLPADVCGCAAVCKHITTVDWLLMHGYKRVIQRGRFDLSSPATLEWLLEQGIEIID